MNQYKIQTVRGEEYFPPFDHPCVPHRGDIYSPTQYEAYRIDDVVHRSGGADTEVLLILGDEVKLPLPKR